jgi:hypothetical protein
MRLVPSRLKLIFAGAVSSVSSLAKPWLQTGESIERHLWPAGCFVLPASWEWTTA